MKIDEMDEYLIKKIANRTADRIFVLAAIIYIGYYLGKLFF